MRLEKYIEFLFENDLLHNIAIRVGRKDEIILDFFKSDNNNVDAKTLFDMASVTKVVVSTMLALIAIDKKMINLDDNLSRFFNNSQKAKEITIKNLLTHTMGIGHKALNFPQNTYANVAEYILNIPSDVSIGSDVLYSCPGYILLGQIIEKVFSKKLDVLFQEYIAAPLGMTNSSYCPDRTKNIVNSNLKDEERGLVNDYNCRFLGGVCGNAGLFSDLDDMTKFAKMLLNYGEPLVNRDIIELASQNFTPNMAEARGLGFIYVDEKFKQTGTLFNVGAIGHIGHTGQSVFVDLKTGLYAIVLSDITNSTIKKYGELHNDEVHEIRGCIHSAIDKELKCER